MKDAIFGFAGTIACAHCAATRFDLPSDQNSNDVVLCRCGAEVGPYRSLVAVANGQSNPPENATLVHISREKQQMRENMPPDITKMGNRNK